MMQEQTRYHRICWYDLEGGIVHSRWYRFDQAIQPALAACRTRWPGEKFWIEIGRPTSLPELTIQDILDPH